MQPLPDETKAELTARGLKPGAPLYVRVFKLENEMEVWMQQASGRYVLFRRYPICNWSGKLGPKLREGDKQAPEGFYVVNARQLNPDSKYHLSFNIGYPNAYDKAHGRTGMHLMVHGGCSSAGCYAITDDAVQELFILARDAFKAGQRAFPVHAFPFHMSDARMAQHRDHDWYPFWVNLKEGYDLFARTGVPPRAAVRDGRYVFLPDDGDAAIVPAALGVQPITGW
jgi:murein L,D-transpeptidase YafK